MLIYQTWFVDEKPQREEMYNRIFRFVAHCKKMGINTPWSLNDVNKQDQRWKRLHKNAVPSILELINKDVYVEECKRVSKLYFAQDVQQDDGEFDF
jgi:hypothetical protein